MASSEQDVQPTPHGMEPTIKRQPLQPLPVAPLNKRPTPIQISSSAASSLCFRPKAVPISSSENVSAFTPPDTPVASRTGSGAMADELKASASAAVPDSEMQHRSAGEAEEKPSIESSKLSWEETTPTLYTSSYTLTTVYGRGAWSTVYRAVETPESPPSLSSPLTPPTSPSQLPRPSPDARILAVKTPIRRDAHSVLSHEARILTYLSAAPLASAHIVQFLGFDAATNSIVMAPETLTLEAYARAALKAARENFTTRTMFDPVIGMAAWKELALGLVRGLNWLQSKGCVHGDIKLANILLSPSPSPASELGHHALYVDFSSSHILSPSSTTPPSALPHDAITPAFTAPELLTGYGKADPSTSPSVATFATDVFSLGVTLIAAAIGESPYESARGEMQRLAMVREGKPLAFARGTEQGTRVMKGREVERGVEGAVRREGRWGLGEWVAVLEGVRHGAPP
ncbi:hypothetical protein MMC30_001835 [Trapelia coarctata]|nr:hypothetical protein [Trapelia coarctata]